MSDSSPKSASDEALAVFDYESKTISRSWFRRNLTLSSFLCVFVFYLCLTAWRFVYHFAYYMDDPDSLAPYLAIPCCLLPGTNGRALMEESGLNFYGGFVLNGVFWGSVVAFFVSRWRWAIGKIRETERDTTVL